MLKRNALKVKAFHTGDTHDWQSFKYCRNNVNNEIELAELSYYKAALTECVNNPCQT